MCSMIQPIIYFHILFFPQACLIQCTAEQCSINEHPFIIFGFTFLLRPYDLFFAQYSKSPLMTSSLKSWWDFSVLAITVVAECFTNITTFIFTLSLGDERVLLLCGRWRIGIWKHEGKKVPANSGNSIRETWDLIFRPLSSVYYTIGS